MRRNIVFGLIFVGMLVLIVAGRAPLERSVIRNFLETYAETHLGRSFAVGSMSRDGDALVFNKVELTEQGAYSLQADQVKVTYGLSFWQRQLDAHIELVKPRLVLSKGAPPSNSIRPKVDERGWWYPRLGLKVTEGEILWNEGSQDKTAAIVTIDLSPGDHFSQGSAMMAIPGKANGGFQINLAEQENRAAAALRFHSFPADLCHSLMQCFLGSSSDLQVSQGALTGTINLISEGASPWRPSGNLAMQDIAISMDQNGPQLRVKDVRLSVDPSTEGDGETIQVQGSLQLVAGGVPSADRALTWKLDGFKGNFTLDRNGNVGFSCRGQWWHEGRVKALRLNGKGNGFSLETASLVFVGTDGAEGKVDVSTQTSRSVVTKITALDATEISFFMKVLAQQFPLLNSWQVSSGTLDGVLVAGNGQAELSGLRAKGLEIRQEPHGLVLSIAKSEGRIALGLDTSGIQRILGGELTLDGGDIAFAVKEGLVGLSTDVLGTLSFNPQGISHADLAGTFPFDGGRWSLRQRAGWNIQISTSGESLATVMPEPFKAPIDRVLRNQQCSLNAILKDGARGLVCQGDLFTGLPNSKTNDRVTFSCRLASPTTGWLAFIGEVINESGSYALVIRDGRFDAKGLSLAHYMSRLFPEQVKEDFSGTADLRGTFDAKQAVMDISVLNGRWDHPLFRFEGSASAKESVSVRAGVDPSKGFLTVFVPFFGASLHDKTHDLLFTDLSTIAEFQGDRLLVKSLEGACEGLIFSADATVLQPFRIDGPLETRIQLKEISGSVQQLKRLMTHFDGGQGLIHRLPLDGAVALNDSGGYLVIQPGQDGKAVEAILNGEVRDAKIAESSGDLTVNELGMRFAYRYPANSLAISDLQGTVLVGRPGRSVEEYRLAGDRIFIHQYPGETVEFDLWVGDKVRDVLRVAGEARADSSDATHLLTQFSFDLKNTHFGNVHPHRLQLALKDWSQVTTFAADVEFDLSTALRDLQRLSRTGLTGLSKRIVDEVQGMSSASGDFSLALAYDHAGPSFTYKLTGQEVHLYDRIFHETYLAGSVQGDSWLLDHLKVDDLSIAADVQAKGDKWKINFLGLRAARALTMGLEGEYDPEQGAFNGRVNLFEVSLSRLKDWQMTRRFGETYQPRGEIRSSGRLVATLRPSPDWCHVQGDFDTLFRGMELSGVRFRDAYRIATHFDSDRGLVLENIQTALLPSRSNDKPIDIRMDRIGYHIAQSEFVVEGGRFQTGQGSMGWMTDVFKAKWDPVAYKLTRDLVDKVVSREGIKGRFAFQLSTGTSAVELALESGTYYYNNHPYVLRDFEASYNPYELKIGGQLEYRGKPLWITLRNECPLSPYGQLILSDRQIDRGDVARDRALAVHWDYDTRKGFAIKKVEGRLFGMEANLRADDNITNSSPYPVLKGRVWVDALESAPMFAAGLTEGLTQAGLKAKYLLDGKWQLSSLLPEWVTFDGEAKAERLELAGYLLDSFQASLELSPKKLRLRNMIVEDPSGTLRASEVRLSKEPGHHWQVSIPEIIVTDFTPSAMRRLQEPGKKRRRDISFPNMTLTNLTGEIGNLSTFAGEGTARFVHATKKKSGKGLLGFTSELMSRMGLDMEMVTPASGIVEYQVREGKITLTRLKDTYSQGKLAKFSLLKDGKPATIDSQGNLDIAIRLKPNQPLLRLTDKMTFLIQGTLKKPIFNLQ